jgi:uncharacterized membrane protein
MEPGNSADTGTSPELECETGTHPQTVKVTASRTGGSMLREFLAVQLEIGPLTRDRIKALAPTILVFSATFAYIVAMEYTSLMKYYTFNATFDDLGVANQVLWLLSHGGVSNYYRSGFAQFFPMQWQKPITFVILPFYALDPHPQTLLVIQSIVLGLPAIPLYYLGKKMLGNTWLAAIVSIAYLTFFPLASANLFDFEFENFAPLFYVLMCLAWETGHRRWTSIAAVFLALVDPLTLALSFFFLVYTLVRDTSPYGSITSTALRMREKLLEDKWRICVLFLLPVLVLIYIAVGSLYSAGVGGGSVATSPVAVIAYAINDKLILFLFLFGALAFIPLMEHWSIWLIAPYAGWVVYSTSSSHWQIFGLMYPILATGPIFYSTLLAFRRIATEDETNLASFNITSHKDRNNTRRPTSSSQRRSLRLEQSAASLVLVMIVFTAVYLPWSPLNQAVNGGYFSGNHDYSGITTFTESDRFLWQTIGLIPANGSVLTQNGIPQVSGREHVQIDIGYIPTEPYDYLLMDTNVTFFSPVATIEPFVSAALENRSFGVLSEGYGALLLQRGYSGSPRLYVPFSTGLDSTELSAYAGTTVEGTSLVRNSSGYSMWYGPYLTLFPGHYTAVYELEINSTVPSNESVLTIDASSNAGSTIYASQTLTGSDFPRPFSLQYFTLNFQLTDISTSIELRGMSPTGVATITLRGIALTQTSYS